MKEIHRLAINHDGKGWSLHIPFNPSDPLTMELEAFQGLVKELPVHPIIGPFYIKLDGHETPIAKTL